MHYSQVLNSWFHTDDTKIITAHFKISLVNVLKYTGIFTGQWSLQVFLIITTTIRLFLGVKQGIQSYLNTSGHQ